MQNIDTIFEEVLNEFQLDCVFEASSSRSPILKKIDENFKEYKDTKSKMVAKKLSKNIKDFSRIPQVDVIIERGSFDACIFTIYNQLLPSIFKRSDEEVKVDKIKAEESPKYIKRIVITIGTKLIKMLEARELTSIILHELGHVYQHTSNISSIIPTLVNKASKLGTTASSLLFFKVLFFSPVNSLYILPFTLSLFTLSRTLTFKDHQGELDADKYAAKYGYGDELARVFYLFNKKFGGNKPRPHTWIQRAWSGIKDFFTFTSHPQDTKRVCDLIRNVKGEYKDKYPRLKKEISTIYADIKC